MDAKTVKQLLRDKGVTEVPIVDMDYNKSLLYGSTGQVFREVSTNLWVTDDEDVAYLGTGRHGGGIILRAMFVKVDGEWVNVVTGNNASFKVMASEDPSSSEPKGRRVLKGMGTAEKLNAIADLCACFAWAPQLDDVYDRVCQCIQQMLHCPQVHFHLMNDHSKRKRDQRLSLPVPLLCMAHCMGRATFNGEGFAMQCLAEATTVDDQMLSGHVA